MGHNAAESSASKPPSALCSPFPSGKGARGIGQHALHDFSVSPSPFLGKGLGVRLCLLYACSQPAILYALEMTICYQQQNPVPAIITPTSTPARKTKFDGTKLPVVVFPLATHCLLRKTRLPPTLLAQDFARNRREFVRNRLNLARSQPPAAVFGNTRLWKI